MGLDDVDGEDTTCVHMWSVESKTVRSGRAAGFGFTHTCRLCGETWYEPSNLELFPDTGGLDPRL